MNEHDTLGRISRKANKQTNKRHGNLALNLMYGKMGFSTKTLLHYELYR